MKIKIIQKTLLLIVSAITLTSCATKNEVKKLVAQSNAALVNIGTTSLGYGPLGQGGMESDQNAQNAKKIRAEAEGQLRGAIAGFQDEPLLRDPFKFRLGMLYTIEGAGGQAVDVLRGISADHLNRRDQILLQAQPALLAFYQKDRDQLGKVVADGMAANPSADQTVGYPAGSHMARLEKAIDQAKADNNTDLVFYLAVAMNDLVIDFAGNGSTRENRPYVGWRLIRASEKSRQYFPKEMIGQDTTPEEIRTNPRVAYRKHHIARIGRLLKERGETNHRRGGPVEAKGAGWESE